MYRQLKEKIYLEFKRDSGNLIHSITNPISINLCANGILALGCQPIMVEHPAETEYITGISAALLLNLGNITDARVESVQLSAETAGALGKPFVLDAVGVGCSELRRSLTMKLLNGSAPTVLKGNYAEIFSLCNNEYHSKGVDGDSKLTVETIIDCAKQLAGQYGCVVLASGETDIISDIGKTALVGNGTPMLGRITGTGCLLGAITAVMLSYGGDAFEAAVRACAVLGAAAESVAPGTLCGTFQLRLLDELSVISADKIKEKMRLEVI
ncbi:MAG: hydroxyethylthiazole kinase [Alistipes sp.]|nr:hydroxyethylthiazole kinase [Alistipes sp.]